MNSEHEEILAELKSMRKLLEQIVKTVQSVRKTTCIWCHGTGVEPTSSSGGGGRCDHCNGRGES